MKDKFSKKKVALYITISYTITWLLWLPLLIHDLLDWDIFILPGQFYLASFGPLLGAILTSAIVDGRKGIRSWFLRAYSFSISKKWLLLAIAMPVLYGIAGFLAHRLIAGEWLDIHRFGLTSKLPGFTLWQTLLVWVVTFGLGEESGWRGFLLPELTKKYSFRISSLIVAGVWILWHLPAFFFNPTYINMGPGIIGWAISLTFGSVVLAWIANGSKYSVIPVIIWHGGFDLITASDQAEEAMAMVCSMLVIIQGIYLIRRMARKESVIESKN
ncbi:MAG TPA: type II CAAX endopeptidase family protein [Lachnospiraceae bacterium]|nr:type II CAAX endopeptidase family protein [Lachnospiraceae bacterium]